MYTNFILFILMKKIFTAVVIIFSMILLWNTALAEDPDGGEPKGTQLADSEIWINLWNSCLTWMWKWCFHYERIVWIDKEQPDYTVTSIAQDILFAAMYMVWTILTVVIIYCGLMYIFAAKDGKDATQYKKWLIWAAIGAVLVRWAYSIVRLIQYIAEW